MPTRNRIATIWSIPFLMLLATTAVYPAVNTEARSVKPRQVAVQISDLKAMTKIVMPEYCDGCTGKLARKLKQARKNMLAGNGLSKDGYTSGAKGQFRRAKRRVKGYRSAVEAQGNANEAGTKPIRRLDREATAIVVSINALLAKPAAANAAPVISIDAPLDGAMVNVAQLQVTGTATDDNQVASVMVNGVTAFLGGGTFVAMVPLQKGQNTILAVATDGSGRTSADSITVTSDDGPPSVVSAVAVSNTEVLLQFSETVQGGAGGAENPGHFNITAADTLGTLPVWDAILLGPDFNTVMLSTFSQSNVTYRITASNIRDLAGNPIQQPTILIDPSSTHFVGVAPGGTEIVDSDADGMADHSELFGWDITVRRTNGTTSTTHVTSDPGDPRLLEDDLVNLKARDTDSDGLWDPFEKQAGADPRNADTDGDTVNDNLEWNVVISEPGDQDTDRDGVDDGTELFYFRSSPIIDDTDGDQLLDGVEILENNRNPRIADLPRSRITVGEVQLRIDERFTFEDAEGTTQTVETSSNSTLAQSENRTFATSDTQVTEHVASVGLETGSESGEGGRGAKAAGGFFFTLSGGYQYTDNHAFQTDNTSAVESQKAHENSLTKAEEITTSSTVTREIFGAAVDVSVTIENAGDLAFAISNLEVTVLQRSRVATNRFEPVATLIPNSTLITGEPAVFNLGPFTPERGPILFSSRDVFPNLVEELMKAPAGLIFEVANFDMTDEFGRVFTFSNQTARDRTAGIIVDFGDGNVERNLVATAMQFDADEVSGQEFVGGFDNQALPLGIPLDFALQDILHLSKNSSQVDGIVAGPNQQADSVALGDDVQLIPPFTTGVSVGSIVVSAGQNGILESVPLGDDEAEVTTGYETSLICNSDDPVTAREICSSDADCGAGLCNGPEVLVRFGSNRTGDFNRQWAVLTTREIPAGADFGKVILKPGEDIFFAFVQDLDSDGLFAQEEYMAGSTDSRSDRFDNALFGETFDENAGPSQVPDGVADSKDTDRDGLGDFAEIRIGWKVSNDGGPLVQTFSSPRLRDSDGDQLLDPVEMDLRRFCVPNDPRGDALCAFQQDPPVVQADAVAIIAGPNGVADSTAAVGDEQLVVQGESGLPYGTPVIGVGTTDGIQTALSGDDLYEDIGNIPPASDPSLADTDADAVRDFAELDGFDIGLSIRDGGNGLAETATNGDDVQKAFLGNPVKPNGIVILPGLNGTIDSTAGGDDVVVAGQSVKTDPLRRDTDSDLVTDGVELAQGGDPTDPLDGQDFRDSDEDGLSDSEETDLGWRIFVNGDTIGVIVKSNPSLPDTDFDGLPDFAERDIRSNPNDADTDGDGLLDFDEFADFQRFLGLEQQFPRFFIDGTSSQRYGTNPAKSDTDGDSLSDYFELLTGYRVLLTGEQSARTVFTNPLDRDTDFDGVDDDVEFNRVPPTDATDPDTDDDGRTDGQERNIASDPLVPDVAVEITMERVIAKKVTGDGANGVAEMTWWFTTLGPSDSNPILLTEPHRARPTNKDANGNPVFWTWGFSPGNVGLSCDWYEMLGGFVTDVSLISSSRVIVLREGQSFSLNGLLGEIDDVSRDCGTAPYYIPSYIRDEQGSCINTFNEVFTFNDFIGGTTGELLSAEVTGVCEFEVQFSLEVKE